MRQHRYRRALGAFAICLAVLHSQAPDLAAQSAFPRDTLLAAARDMMAAARYCALVTIDETGAPRIRMMDPFAPDDDMTIWLGTNRRSRKIKEISGDPRVALYFVSPDAVGYVDITGRAEIVDDEEEKKTRWKPEWEPFYEDRAADFLLIRVVPERLEIIDLARGIAGDPTTWAPPAVEFR